MSVFPSEVFPFFLSSVLAIFPALFWFWFYYVYIAKSEERFRRLFRNLTILGIFVAIPAYVIERFGLEAFRIFSSRGLAFLPGISDTVSPVNFPTVLSIFAVSFLFVAPVEELVKFSAIRFLLYRSLVFDRVIDMIRGGVAVGLGFATAENILYFANALFVQNTTDFFDVFVLRFFISTFAHTLYSAVMGYWLGLAKFHALYQKQFLRYALWLPILLHGFFNFFLLIDIGIFSMLVLFFVAFILLHWFNERRNFQAFLSVEEARRILPPLLAGRHEVEGLLYLGNLTYEQTRKLSFCPFCLAKKETVEQKQCKNCNAQLRGI